MSVILTTRPAHQAAPPPSTIAIMISTRLPMPGTAKVARVASTMPTPAQAMPRRAFTGDDIAFRPTTNSTATTR